MFLILLFHIFQITIEDDFSVNILVLSLFKQFISLTNGEK